MPTVYWKTVRAMRPLHSRSYGTFIYFYRKLWTLQKGLCPSFSEYTALKEQYTHTRTQTQSHTVTHTVFLYKCIALIQCHKMVHDNQRDPAEMLLYVFFYLDVSFAFITLAEAEEKTSHSRVWLPFSCSVFFFLVFFVFFSLRVSVPASEQIVRLCVMFINLCPEIFKAAFRNSFFAVFSLAGLGAVSRAGEKKKITDAQKKKLEIFISTWLVPGGATSPKYQALRELFLYFVFVFFFVEVVVVPDSSVVTVKNYYCWLIFLQCGRQHPQHTLTISTIYQFWKTSIISHFILETNGSRKHTLCSFSTQPDLFILYIL